MEHDIEAIVQHVCSAMKNKPANRKAIQNNYNLIYSAIKNGGYTEFVAHQWAVLKLSKIYGSIKVKNAVQVM